eukprot:gb/GEZN01022532.1/.p1 GENE.gb/GEZN01022532.1/~~gb/GEZN01022532.1/.p1  ORF type:complete len:142 (-),score=24.40 gb/GEZN01022532.1/:109-534(-)
MDVFCDSCGSAATQRDKVCPECGETLTAINRVSSLGELSVTVAAQKEGHVADSSQTNAQIFVPFTPRTAFLKKQIYHMDTLKTVADGGHAESDKDDSEDEEHHHSKKNSNKGQQASKEGPAETNTEQSAKTDTTTEQSPKT